jgi:hypothetical protein
MYGIGKTAAGLTGLITVGCLAFGVVFAGIAYADDGDDSGSSINGAPGKPGQADTHCRQQLYLDLYAPMQCTEYTPSKKHRAKVTNGQSAKDADNSRDQNNAHGTDGQNGGNGSDGSRGKDGANGSDDNVNNGITDDSD